MTEPTAAQRLIETFEHGHPDQTVFKEDLASLAVSLGGDPYAVRQCRWDTSVLAYICALTVRNIENSNSAQSPDAL